MKNLELNKELFKKKVVPFAIATSLFSGGLSYLAIDKSKDSEYVEMSEQVRQSVYYDNPEFSEEYKMSENSNIDESINTKSLREVENLDIDLAFYEDLSFLKYCNNLKRLTIRDTQFLRDKDAEYIKGLNLRELNLSFNPDHIDVEGINTDYDFKDLKCDNISIGFESVFNPELKTYMLYLWGKNTFGNKNFYLTNKEQYELIDKKIDSIIQNKSIRKKDNDADTLMSALIGVCDYFKYDDDVEAAYLFNYEDKESEKQIIDYNKRDLSSTLLDKNGKGVCVNVTAILNAILYKLNIESYVVNCDVLGMGHALSIVNIDDDWKYVDATSIDEYFKNGDLGYKEYTEAKTKEEKKKEYNNLKKTILINGDKAYEEYFEDYTIVPYIDIDELTEEDRRIIVDTVINKGLEGQEIEHRHNNVLPIGIALGSGLIVLLVPTLRRRNEMNKELSVEEKIVKRKEDLIKLKEFLKKNTDLLTGIGGVTAADYYLQIMPFDADHLPYQLSIGITFVGATMVAVFGGCYLLREYAELKEDTVKEDILVEEAEKLRKEQIRLHKEFEKDDRLRENCGYVRVMKK